MVGSGQVARKRKGVGVTQAEVALAGRGGEGLARTGVPQRGRALQRRWAQG